LEPVAEQPKSLLAMRIIWFVMLCGMALFGAMILFLSKDFSEPDADMSRLFLIISGGTLFFGVPFGYLFRMQTYKKHWRDDAVTLGGYFTGNLMLWAIIEGATFVALTGCLTSQSLWPCLIPAIVGVLLLVVNFPTGRPMQPLKPGLMD